MKKKNKLYHFFCWLEINSCRLFSDICNFFAGIAFCIFCQSITGVNEYKPIYVASYMVIFIIVGRIIKNKNH